VVPADVAKIFASRKQALIDGSLLPFAGPLKDNHGTLKVSAQASVSIDDLMSLNWFVDGVDASIPQ
jgi:basic membrane protein A